MSLITDQKAVVKAELVTSLNAVLEMIDTEPVNSSIVKQAIADFIVNYESTAEHRLLLRLLA